MKSKYILSIILFFSLIPCAFSQTFTYTSAQIQALLDEVNSSVAESSGAADAGKIVKLNASGLLDASLGGGGIATVQEGNVPVGGSDIVTMDFDAGVFAITESPDTEINVDIQDDGIDSQHYVAGSIDPEHLNIANAETDEYALTYEADTSNFQWVAIPGGGDITTVGLCTTGDCTADFIDATDMADGDYGDFSFSVGAATLDADVVSTAEMADADHGDFTYSGGTATLDADVVDSAEIADDAINSEHYVTASIDTLHLSNDIITGAKIADDAVDSEHYAAGSIDAEHLAADIIDETKLADNSIDSEHYNDGSIDAAHLAADIIDETKLADNSIDSEHYNDGSIDTAHIAADAIDGTLIADDAIDSEHYTDASIDPAHINFVVAPAAGSDEYAVTYEHSTGNFELVSIAGGGDITTVGDCLTGDCTDDFIDGTDIADDSIDSEHYAAGSIDLEHMSVNSIDSDQYVDGSIDLAHMSANSVDSDQYVDGSIDLIHMSANSVDSDQYVDASIDLAHMSAESIDSDQHVDASIDPEHLNFVVVPGAGNDEYAVTYENSTGQFELVSISAGGTMTTVLQDNSEVDDAVVKTDYNVSVFVVSEDPAHEMNIGIKKQACTVVENMSSSEQNIQLGTIPYARTVVRAWCRYRSTIAATTVQSFTIEDVTGNNLANSGDVTLTCVQHTTAPSEDAGLETYDTNQAFVAWEALESDAILDSNCVGSGDPYSCCTGSGTGACEADPTTYNYEICVEYTIP